MTKNEKEILEIFSQLSEDMQRELIHYAKFLKREQEKEKTLLL